MLDELVYRFGLDGDPDLLVVIEFKRDMSLAFFFVTGNDLHPDSQGYFGNLLSNLSEADDPQGLSPELHAPGIVLLQLFEPRIPFQRHHPVRIVKEPYSPKKVGKYQFSHRGRGGGGGVDDLDAFAAGVVNINVVHPHAATAN